MALQFGPQLSYFYTREAVLSSKWISLKHCYQEENDQTPKVPKHLLGNEGTAHRCVVWFITWEGLTEHRGVNGWGPLRLLVYWERQKIRLAAGKAKARNKKCDVLTQTIGSVAKQCDKDGKHVILWDDIVTVNPRLKLNDSEYCSWVLHLGALTPSLFNHLWKCLTHWN